METRHPLAPDPEPESADGPERLSAIRRFVPSPTLIATLGFLSVPGFLYEPLEALQVFAFCFLAGLWPLVAGISGIVYGAVTGGEGTETGAESEATADEVEPTDWIDSGGRTVNARALVSMLVLQFQPILFVTGLLQLAGHVPIIARYRGDLPSAADYESDVDYRLPLEGTWTVVNGSPDREYSHSWGLLTQRYAYDFVITDEDGRTTKGERGPPEEYYCFGEPILAPAGGVVVSTRTDHRDYHRTNGWMDPLQRSILGNHVVIDHENGEYSVLAHLQQGSVAVEPGERVDRGQRVARCGNSGNTTEPTSTSTCRIGRRSSSGWDSRSGSPTFAPTTRRLRPKPATRRTSTPASGWHTPASESTAQRLERRFGTGSGEDGPIAFSMRGV